MAHEPIMVGGTVVRRSRVILLIGVLLLAVASLLIAHQKQYYAAGRLFVEFPNGNYSYAQSLTNLQTISNLLSSSDSSNRLAAVSQFQNGSFTLMKVTPIRGVWAVQLVYSGSDQEGVERITSNACVIVQQFFATNQPGKVQHVESSRVDAPKPEWWWEVKNFFGR